MVFGRDDKDLLQAAKGIAQGNILFRGESVVVNEVKPLLPRKAVRCAELGTYRSSGSHLAN